MQRLLSRKTAAVITVASTALFIINKPKEDSSITDIPSKFDIGLATNKILKDEKAKEWIRNCEKDPELQRLEYGQINKLFDKEMLQNGECRNFLVSEKMNQLDNHHFDFVLYLNEKEKKILGLCYFGKYLQGRPGMAHGGASASVLDGLMGEICFVYGYKAATLNLNVNYKKFLPLDTVVILESKIDKIEGRKLFVSSALKDLKDESPYCEATSLYIVPRK